MKLNHLPEYATFVVALAIGLILSSNIGAWAGGGNTSMAVMTVAGVLALLVALVMRSNIWIFIPLFAPMGGQIIGIPGSFPVRDLAILYVFPVFLALKALRVVRVKTQYHWLDFILFLNLFYLATVFARNPVGTESMGVDRVGGRAYFETAICMMGYWVMAHVTVSPQGSMRLPIVMIAGDWLNAAIGALTHYVPSTVPVIGRFYSGISTDSYEAQTGQGPAGGAEMEQGRQGYMGDAGSGVLRILYARYSPLTSLNPLYLKRFLYSILGLSAIFISGFRSSFVGIAGIFFICSYFRDGIGHVLKSILVCSAILLTLVVMQGNLLDLPNPMQRALSFLPGKWDPLIVEEARGSSEWRLDVWARVWDRKNNYIQNWWFGDGFGMSRYQYQKLAEMSLSHDANVGTEALILSGCYHSLPLTAIHIVGYVGFGFFCVLLFGSAFYARQLIERTRNTPFFSMALFVGAPTIWSPLPTLILTGFYDVQLLALISTIAMMKMINRSLERYKQELHDALPKSGDTLPELAQVRFPERSF